MLKFQTMDDLELPCCVSFKSSHFFQRGGNLSLEHFGVLAGMPAMSTASKSCEIVKDE
jgi:hypothetical protein